MVRSVECKFLSDKLDHFFSVASLRNDPPFPLADPTNLAFHLGCNPGRISEWKHGTRTRAAGRVPPPHLEKLGALYAQMTEGLVSQIEGVEIWRSSTAEAFRNGIVVKDGHIALEGVLRAKRSMVEIDFIREAQMLGLIDQMYDPGDSALKITIGKKFFLRIGHRRASRLILLCETPEGLQWLIPGLTHDGTFGETPERVPHKEWWRFQTIGQHRLIAIVIDAKDFPWVRKMTAISTMNSQEIEQLAHMLREKIWSGKWNWGDLEVFVVSPS